MRRNKTPAIATVMILAFIYTNTNAASAQFSEESLRKLPEIGKSYKVDPYLRAVAGLQSLGKERASEMLMIFAKREPRDKRIVILCRMLYIKKAKADFRSPRIGMPDYLGVTETKDWPLSPIAIVDGVPFLIATGYSGSGIPESMDSYLKYCLRDCEWSSQKFNQKSRVKKHEALEKLVESPKLKLTLTKRERVFLELQIE